jgi:hypothetical protein
LNILILVSKKLLTLITDFTDYKLITDFTNFKFFLGLEDIIFRPTLSQSFKGILTAGLSKSAKYTTSKIGKWISRP